MMNQSVVLGFTTLDIPSYTAIPKYSLPDSFRHCLTNNYQQQLVILEKAAHDETVYNQTHNTNYTHSMARYEKFKLVTPDVLDDVFAYLNGAQKRPILDLGKYESFRDDNLTIILYKDLLQQLPECNLWHLLRAYYLEEPILITEDLYNLFESEPLVYQADLRQIADLLVSITGDHDVSRYIADALLLDFSLPMLVTYIVGKEDKLWPFFAENPIYIDDALGIKTENSTDVYRGYKIPNALVILSLFPKVPNKYISYLLELALGENRRSRLAAQKILNKIPNIHLEVEKTLASSKQELRIVAANWLAELGHNTSIGVLKKALQIEKKEPVIVSILNALSRLGEDISRYLSRKYLKNEAKKALKAKIPVSINWLHKHSLPHLTWQNGENVDPDIVYWWIVLAVKFKRPDGNELFDLYLGLLDVESQKKLGLFVLQMFIYQDTKRLSSDEAEKKAQILAPQELQDYQITSKQFPEIFPEDKNMTLEYVINNLKSHFQWEYIGTAKEAKGMLALSKYIDVYQAVQIVNMYLKGHSSRRSQISSVLEAIATIYHPAIIQLLLTVANRYSSNIVRKKATALLEQIADNQNCTVEELTDIMVSNANLDPQGVLVLDYGGRTFKATLTNSLQLVLTNSDGKIIKSLPAANKNEDINQVNLCKKELSNSKKEIKKVISFQTARLYEKMCIEQNWSYNQWYSNFYQHPIMNRLIQRLVWLEIDSQQQIINSFRPTEDGSLINLDDEEIVLNPSHNIRLAHRIYLSDEQSSRWLAHLEDYKVLPLFVQFSCPLPDINHVKDNQLEDCYGQFIGRFILQRNLVQRGYQFIDDWDRVEGFFKIFKPLGIRACIRVSNFYKLSTDNETIQLYQLYFTQRLAMIDKPMQIDKVPPIILAECYADYCSLIKNK